MKIKTVLTIAMTAMLIGALAGAKAVANDGSESEVIQLAQATPPDTPDTPDTANPPTVTCPRCGADCPAPSGRQGRGMRASKGRSFRGSGIGRRGHGPHGGFGQGAGVPADRMLRGATRLELADDQITQLEKLSYDTKSKLIDLESDLEKAHLEMQRQMETDGDNLSAMKKHLDSMAKIRVNIQELKLKNWIDAKNVLTDEQKQNVKDQFPRFGMKL